MKRPLIQRAPIFIILFVALMASCAYFRKPDKPPPLPTIVETKPPLTLKGEYFRSFPWDELPKPRKDGNDPDTFTYTVKEGDKLETVAQKMMGDSNLAVGLASYNELSSPMSVPVGEKLVIPFPILGMSCHVLIKAKGDKLFGAPETFDVQFRTGDRFKMRFESNVDGHCYVFRQGLAKTQMLYPPVIKSSKKEKKDKKPAIKRGDAEVKAHKSIEIPLEKKKAFIYKPKMTGDRVYFFVSLRQIPELEDLKEKKKIGAADLEDVMHRVKEGDILSDPPIKLLRISDPSQVLGFVLNIKGE